MSDQPAPSADATANSESPCDCGFCQKVLSDGSLEELSEREHRRIRQTAVLAEICCNCGIDLRQRTDRTTHIIRVVPQSRGGGTEWHNAAILCGECHDRLPRAENGEWTPTSEFVDRRQRKEARHQFDNYQCQSCGRSRHGEHTADLQLHHIVPVRNGGRHCLRNLRTLCRDCHAIVHGISLPERQIADAVFTFVQQFCQLFARAIDFMDDLSTFFWNRADPLYTAKPEKLRPLGPRLRQDARELHDDVTEFVNSRRFRAFSPHVVGTPREVLAQLTAFLSECVEKLPSGYRLHAWNLP